MTLRKALEMFAAKLAGLASSRTFHEFLRRSHARRSVVARFVSQVPSGEPGSAGLIELRVDRMEALFDPFDPFPAPSRDLAPQVEDFVIGWARELPSEAALRVVVHMPAVEADNTAGGETSTAFQRHFSYRAERVGGDIAELMRIGRHSLLIGLAVLATCSAAGRLMAGILPADLARFGQESLLILGWVANWRPIEIFLYDWWPLTRRRELLRRLAAASVEVRADL